MANGDVGPVRRTTSGFSGATTMPTWGGEPREGHGKRSGAAGVEVELGLLAECRDFLGVRRIEPQSPS